MVRDPIDQMSTSNSIDFDKEETRSNKRASSIGATFRRLFSKSPAPQYERFSSETKTSESVSGAGHRGRTPPKTTNSLQISTDSIESSILRPNNPYFVPVEMQRANFTQYMWDKSTIRVFNARHGFAPRRRRSAFWLRSFRRFTEWWTTVAFGAKSESYYINSNETDAIPL